MSDAEKRPQVTAKRLLLVIVVAIVMALVVTLAQTLIMGRANIAVTGGIVGAICGFLAVTQIRKNPNQKEN
jgi:hypothetical protein